MSNCEEAIVAAAIQKYYERKWWRWEHRPCDRVVMEGLHQRSMQPIFGSPPPKRRRLQDIEVAVDESVLSNESSSSSDEESSDEENGI